MTHALPTPLDLYLSVSPERCFMGCRNPELDGLRKPFCEHHWYCLSEEVRKKVTTASDSDDKETWCALVEDAYHAILDGLAVVAVEGSKEAYWQLLELLVAKRDTARIDALLKEMLSPDERVVNQSKRQRGAFRSFNPTSVEEAGGSFRSFNPTSGCAGA